MSFVIRNEGLAGITAHGGDRVPIGAYLAWYNPDARDGIGEADWTLDPSGAMQFDSAEAALRAYRAVSTVRPVRADGKPNRPLTAFTVSIEAA